jgi:ABC-type multidrug transport system fused ATPase/permease subunit
MLRATKIFLNALFFLFSISGFVVIFFSGKWENEYTIIIPILLVSLYGLISGKALRDCYENDTADHYLDSIYLLGFMYTLIALVSLFLRLYKGMNDGGEGEILQSSIFYLGISVTTSVAGVFFRNVVRGAYLKNHPSRPDDLEKTYELLQSIAQNFSENYQNTFQQIQIFLEERARSTKTLAENEKKYAESLKRFSEGTERFGAGLKEDQTQLRESLSELSETLSGHNETVNRIKNLTEEFAEAARKIRYEAAEAPLEKVNLELSNFKRGVEELNLVLDGIISVVEKKVKQI